jgi:type VI secretion system protein ImpM
MSETAVNRAPEGATVPGWYGKIPNLGDFVARRLPEAFVHDWDDWLQHGIAKAQQQLREAWLARYLVAPVRRLWLAPGVVGDEGWAGVMMPSVDAVGRHFPLTIAAPLGAQPGSLARVLAAPAWFDAIDTVARQVLDVEFSADEFEAVLAQVAPLRLDAAADEAAVHRAQALLSGFGATPCSVWWCGDASAAPPFECFAALPPASAFASLLVEPGPQSQATAVDAHEARAPSAP